MNFAHGISAVQGHLGLAPGGGITKWLLKNEWGFFRWRQTYSTIGWVRTEYRTARLIANWKAVRRDGQKHEACKERGKRSMLSPLRTRDSSETGAISGQQSGHRSLQRLLLGGSELKKEVGLENCPRTGSRSLIGTYKKTSREHRDPRWGCCPVLCNGSAVSLIGCETILLPHTETQDSQANAIQRWSILLRPQ